VFGTAGGIVLGEGNDVGVGANMGMDMGGRLGVFITTGVDIVVAAVDGDTTKELV
jgi:hypothetical protein